MPWIRRTLRGNTVFAQCDASGALVSDASNRVEIVYKLVPGAKAYRASTTNLQSTGDPADDTPIDSDVEVGAGKTAETGKTGKKKTDAAPLPADAIIIYTDGACSGNPGPCGLGAVVIDGEARQELSEYLGTGTNNIAELTAIERALQAVPAADRTRCVVVHSDSSYAIGLLEKGWKAKANADLVARIRRTVALFPTLRFVKVKGHAGIPENERADELARLAVETR